MWLIHASKLTLHEFKDGAIPPYNILSHTWGSQEISFRDMRSGNAKAKEAFAKIENTCRLSLERQQGQSPCSYVWVDTCCIDKRSSAELSEAINSTIEDEVL